VALGEMGLFKSSSTIDSPAKNLQGVTPAAAGLIFVDPGTQITECRMTIKGAKSRQAVLPYFQSVKQLRI